MIDNRLGPVANAILLIFGVLISPQWLTVIGIAFGLAGWVLFFLSMLLW
jgi:hypothetical protein